MFNQAFVNIKLYEFNLTLKKVVLKKGICIKKKIIQTKMDEIQK